MRAEDKEPTMVPTDIEGHVLPTLTPEQEERKVELEYDRLFKTSLKHPYTNWTREEKQLMITWAFNRRFDTKTAEFKDIVKMFKLLSHTAEHKILRAMPSKNGMTRDLDVWCLWCGRLHTFQVAPCLRETWSFDPPCWYEEGFDVGTKKIVIEDTTSVKNWEIHALEKMAKNKFVKKGENK